MGKGRRMAGIGDWLLGAFLLYCGFVFVLWMMQRQILYVPSPVRQDRAVWNAADMDIVTVRTEDGLDLEGWYKPPAKGKPVIVVFHGNASHMGASAWKARPYMDAGYGALLPAYRGYAGNPGSPDEQGLYKDAAAFLDWLAKEKDIPPARTVLLGESLGSGVAVAMAADRYRDVKAVVLESPYTSFADLAQVHYPFIPFARYLVRDHYPSIDRIGALTAPLLIVHGRRDVVVPFSQGERLFTAANEPKQMLAVDAAGHNDLYMYGVADGVLHFLSSL